MPESTGATIPRVPHLAPHLAALLRCLGVGGASFEQCRRTYMGTAGDLAARGKGRAVASRVGEQEAYWAPTADLLSEAMLLGLVETEQVPSARRYLGRHADRTYQLTTAGVDASELADDDSAFTTLVVDMALAKHPTFRAFVLELERSPLVLPVIDISDLDAASSRGSLDELADRAAAEINSSGAGAVTSAGQVLAAMRSWSARRFAGRTRDDPPSKKDRAVVLSEACAAVALEVRGIGGGPSDLKNLRAWGSNFRITDQSRYTSGSVGPFKVWLAADLVRPDQASAGPGAVMSIAMSIPGVGPGVDSDAIGVRRRGFACHGERIADALIEAYFRQASGTALEAPYLPIHAARAEAAFRCRVVRVLVDRVADGLVHGSIARPAVRMQLRIFREGDHPDSEPVYSRGGSPRYSMSIARLGTHEGGIT